jgi:predicted ATPase
MLEQVLRHTHGLALKPFHIVALAMQGALLIGREDSARGTATLREVLQKMRTVRQLVVGTFVACWMADGLSNSGRPEAALAVVREARRNAVGGAEAVHLPELLRLQAQALLSISQANEARALRLLLRSCRIARRQSALSWELRSTLTLTRIRARSGDCESAHRPLSRIYGQFIEGFQTRDLKAARQLLAQHDGKYGARLDGDGDGEDQVGGDPPAAAFDRFDHAADSGSVANSLE